MMNSLLIIGAGGHGRCCLDIARDMNSFDDVAFVDDIQIGEIITDCEVIGGTSDLVTLHTKFNKVFVAIGNNELRKKLILQALQIGYEVVNLISPHSVISQYANIGMGCVVFPYVVIEAEASIGNGCIIAANASINHNAYINDYCLIYSNSVIRPNTNIGELTTIGSSCVVCFGLSVETKSYVKDGSMVEV